MLKNVNLISTVIKYRSMIMGFAIRDFQNKYAGTLGQGIWIFAHPLATIVIYYYVFAVGFRAQAPHGIPFVLWFVGGLIPWYFFNDTLQAMTNSITSNAYLVKKTVFPTELLTISHLIAGVFPHIVFLIMLLGLMVFYNVPFLFERIIIVYFFICNSVLLLGLGWMFSSLQVFYRDIGQGLSIILNMLFWLTPIVWSMELMPEEYRYIIHYNPLFYIINGYRNAMIYDSVTYPGIMESLYFWLFLVIVFVSGNRLFFKLKPEFSDVM